MATFSRLTALLFIAVFVTYYRESEAQYTVMVHGTREKLDFKNKGDFDKWMELGMRMFGKTFDGICWYSQLKAFPFSKQSGFFSDCYIPPQIRAIAMNKTEEYCLKVFMIDLDYSGEFSIPEYHSQCKDLISTPRATPNTDESSVLNDKEVDYAFKAYFHCVIHQVREILGEKAIEDIKHDRMDSKKGWMPMIHDRVNEFRSRHGVEALQLNKTLMNDAQKRTDSMAETCTRGETLQDGLTEENICVNNRFHSDGPAVALQCVNNWYRMIKYYPFPRGLDAGTSGEKYRTRDFVHVVWKGVKSVGYGYSFNPKCGPQGEGQGFLVAQFHPVGGKDGEYNKNVLPPV